jgi:NADH-quinone oxidoreductase subunit L
VVAYYLWGTARDPVVRLERNPPFRALHTFLVEKYYLDRIFVDGVVGSIKGPIARAAYWVNQKVIDAVPNGIGVGTKAVARFTYDWIDQRVVDGAINGVAAGASETGGTLRLIQSGRIQQYALYLFAGVGLLALALVVFTL